MTLTPADYARLEALAREATPGPWEIVRFAEGTFEERLHGVLMGAWEDAPKQRHHVLADRERRLRRADVVYIAAVSPDVTLALLARVRELEAERDALRTHATGALPPLTEALLDECEAGPGREGSRFPQALLAWRRAGCQRTDPREPQAPDEEALVADGMIAAAVASSTTAYDRGSTDERDRIVVRTIVRAILAAQGQAAPPAGLESLPGVAFVVRDDLPSGVAAVMVSERGQIVPLLAAAPPSGPERPALTPEQAQAILGVLDAPTVRIPQYAWTGIEATLALTCLRAIAGVALEEEK